jgi:uncharacterized repeat protein (TIGR03803 family)
MSSKLILAAALAVALPLSASAATETILYAFPGGGGFALGTGAGLPLSDLIQDETGDLFGTTNFGGKGCGSNGPGCGTVYRLHLRSPSEPWRIKILTSFHDGSDGSYPVGGVTAGSNGVLYGTASGGGSGVASAGAGLVFELIPPVAPKTSWKRKILYRFPGGDGGATPMGRLLRDASGALYGTTQFGGTSNNGTIFKLTPPAPGKTSWKRAVLYSFAGGDDGSQPMGGLLQDIAGNLYGTTAVGGNTNNPMGTVFKLSLPAAAGGSWTETVIYRFTGGSDGAFPGASNLVSDASGVLYGTTLAGGGDDTNVGTVFSLTPPAPGRLVWKERILHRFKTSDGTNPNSGVTIDPAGNLYGITTNGAPAGFGSVFKLAPPAVAGDGWAFTKLHIFTGGTDGIHPKAGLLLKTDGTLFGTSSQGGGACPALTADGCGTAFQIVP